MEKVALELLNKCPEMCKINKVNYKGETALIYAHRYNMEKVEEIILRYVDICKIFKLTSDQKNIFNRYIDMILVEKINNMPDAEDIKIRHKELSVIDERIKKFSKDRECLMCCEETSHNIFFVECRHMLCICNVCVNMLDKKCPICKTTTHVITKCFIV
jgi:hypothetical protein